jgi:hypothetical protein
MPEKHKAGGAKGRLLTPELQVIWRKEHQGEAEGKSLEEKKALRQKQMEKLAAMSESERTSLRDQLQAKWNALPAGKKKKLEQKISERRAAKKEKKKKNHAGGGNKD